MFETSCSGLRRSAAVRGGYSLGSLLSEGSEQSLTFTAHESFKKMLAVPLFPPRFPSLHLPSVGIVDSRLYCMNDLPTCCPGHGQHSRVAGREERF